MELDQRLRQDNHVLGRLPAGRVLLNRNALVPWFVLVPDTELIELHQLPDAVRIRVVGAQDGLSRFIKWYFECDKMNVAALGNQVSQLHIHVIGRRHDDPCWPDPVWGRLPDGPGYTPAALDALVAAMGERLRLEPGDPDGA